MAKIDQKIVEIWKANAARGFPQTDPVYVMFEQNGIINQFHVAYWSESGIVHTSCGMVLMSGRRPSHATSVKPEESSVTCCSSCATKISAFSKKFFGGRNLPVKKLKIKKSEIGQIGDEMMQVASEEREQCDVGKQAGRLF